MQASEQATSPAPTPTPTKEPKPTKTATPKPEPKKTQEPKPKAKPTKQDQDTTEVGTQALALLEQTPIKGRTPKTGYDRDEFGNGWEDINANGCDTRIICTLVALRTAAV